MAVHRPFYIFDLYLYSAYAAHYVYYIFKLLRKTGEHDLNVFFSNWSIQTLSICWKYFEEKESFIWCLSFVTAQFLMSWTLTQKGKLCKMWTIFSSCACIAKNTVQVQKTSFKIQCNFHFWLFIYRTNELTIKKIIWQTLHAVDYCHQHNVSTLILCYMK